MERGELGKRLGELEKVEKRKKKHYRKKKH